MSKEKRRVPKLRFPGFTEDWEQHKLNDFVTIRRGLTYKPSDIAENGIRVLRSSNIDEDQFIKSNDDVFVNLAAVNIPFAKNGDILITSANGSNRLVGKHTIINDIAENSAVPGGFMLLAESNNPLFTDALLSSNWYKRFINTYVAGGNGAIGNLSKSDLESQSVMVPSEYEQTKIGQWYDNINQLITLHQRKLEHLNLKKKALLQKLFPKNGERYPEFRFPGFTDAWEQRKLGSILIEYTEKNPGNENLPVLTSSRQGLTKQEDHFGSVQRHDISDYNVIPLGFCTYRNRSDDKTFTFNINRIVPRGLVSKFYPVFEIKNGNADFITEYLNNNTEIIKSLVINAVGTSQVVLSLRTLKNIEITLPLKAEQVAIGNLMRKLDIYITLHQRKLEHLQLQKKALLQQMFV